MPMAPEPTTINFFGTLVHHDGVPVLDDLLAVDLGAGQASCACADGDDEVLRGQVPLFGLRR